MTEEEYFRKNYPDSCYGDKPLSPHWDFFQDGVEFGERQSEKKIEELEAELKEWKDKAELWCKTANLKDHNIMINKELQKENAELKCECRRCVYSDCPCILSDYGKDRNGICDHFKDVFDEIIELKDKVDTLQGFLDRDVEFDNLQKENAELKKQLGNLFEIIKRPYQFTAPRKIQMVKEAEQFIKE